MNKTFEEKKGALYAIYDRFEQEIVPYRQQAFCREGCSFCCTSMGNIDIITLEGLVIVQHIEDHSEEFRETIRKRISENRLLKERGQKPPCPFLNDSQSCLIYAARPFSCRQLYSVRECGAGGPMAHRQAVESARATVPEIQQLDDTGYSGHISYILHLFDDPAFRKLYLSGGFAPDMIMNFGKAHGLVIHKRSSPARPHK